MSTFSYQTKYGICAMSVGIFQLTGAGCQVSDVSGKMSEVRFQTEDNLVVAEIWCRHEIFSEHN